MAFPTLQKETGRRLCKGSKRRYLYAHRDRGSRRATRVSYFLCGGITCSGWPCGGTSNAAEYLRRVGELPVFLSCMTRRPRKSERGQGDCLFNDAQSGVVVAVDAVLSRVEPAGSPRASPSRPQGKRSMGQRRRGYVPSPLQIPIFVAVLAYCVAGVLSMCSNSCSKRGDCNRFGR